MARKFETVAGYYARGLWTVEQVYKAVARGWITSEDYEKITGNKYEGEAHAK